MDLQVPQGTLVDGLAAPRRIALGPVSLWLYRPAGGLAKPGHFIYGYGARAWRHGRWYDDPPQVICYNSTNKNPGTPSSLLLIGSE
jgi:hypothetical protein